jgi:hypothetical protein
MCFNSPRKLASALTNNKNYLQYDLVPKMNFVVLAYWVII